ncbi:hypothetical protein ACWDBF_00760 [Streptomyces angustmyceticus]|uniref:hypothetical protein n=1 Tax=Streptomyces angustmyceticus TaxID=285578 RepID=UPI0021AF9E45|nr:hypothetical protein [Streptomyces angustmyceticus]
MGSESTPSLLGTRPRTEVLRASAALAQVTHDLSQTGRSALGALAAYRWALGDGAAAPITGFRTEGCPTVPALTAEVDAAAVQWEGTRKGTAAHDYLRGVHTALAWICGYTERRP